MQFENDMKNSYIFDAVNFFLIVVIFFRITAVWCIIYFNIR